MTGTDEKLGNEGALYEEPGDGDGQLEGRDQQIGMHPEAAPNRTIGEELWREIKKDLTADLERAEMEVEMANGGGQGSQEEMRRPGDGREREGSRLLGNEEGLRQGGVEGRIYSQAPIGLAKITFPKILTSSTLDAKSHKKKPGTQWDFCQYPPAQAVRSLDKQHLVAVGPCMVPEKNDTLGWSS